MANYLYNGVELPALPEWDKTKYPYAYITDYSATKGMYALTLISQRAVNNKTYYYDGFISTPGKGNNVPSYLYRFYVDSSTDWGEGTYVESGGIADTSYPLLWASVDVLNSDDDSIYFPASDPIPVTPEIDPTSMLQGWIVGRRIAGQRK